MTEKNYTGYSVEDLLHDQEFVITVKSINTSEEWEQFLQSRTSPDRVSNPVRASFIQARKIIQLFKTNEGTLPDEKKNKLWENIYRFKVEHSGNHKLFTLKTFARIAASILIIISLGGILYLHFNRIENQYQFAESRNDLKTDKPLLVLSNGTKVELKKSESKITVLKDQDAIQINNDSIVKNQTYVGENTAEVKFNEVIIPFGTKSKLVLADGTTVWLNAGSRFAFPSKFNGKKREVILEGEAYFEVAKNAQKPFIVSTDNVNIEVYGTKFNVSAYGSDNLSETVLLEGSVSIWDNGRFFKDKIQMVPNQKATYDKTGKEIVLRPEPEPERTIAWVEGWYQYTNEKLEVVLKKLERYYNVRFEYDHSVISKVLPVSGKLDLKGSLDEVLVVLSKVAKFEYQISGNIANIKNSKR